MPEAGEVDANSPLAFLLAVMADDAQPMEARMQAAGLALPYCHAKPTTAPTRPAAPADEWGGLLAPDDLYAPRKVKPVGRG